MTGCQIDIQWLDGTPEEGSSFAELIMSLNGETISDIADPVSGAVSGVRLPLSPLAQEIAERWWVLMYEPQKADRDLAFEARHRLDAFTPGYVFPPLALWSGGAEGVSATLLAPDTRFHRYEFRLPDIGQSWFLPRAAAETAWLEVIRDVAARDPNSEICQALDRLTASRTDPAERSWCEAAGRLGLDPYDPDTPDLDQLAEGVAGEIFADLCDVGSLVTLPRLRQALTPLQTAVTAATRFDVGALGRFPDQLSDHYAPFAGYDAAERVRATAGLTPDDDAVNRLILGTIADDTDERDIQGLAIRDGDSLALAVRGKDRTQQRFRLCRGLFLGWQQGPAAAHLVSSAKTWRQQASRAFAAELLAPAAWLRERAGRQGLTESQILVLAQERRCGTQIIREQARNHYIRLAA